MVDEGRRRFLKGVTGFVAGAVVSAALPGSVRALGNLLCTEPERGLDYCLPNESSCDEGLIYLPHAGGVYLDGRISESSRLSWRDLLVTSGKYLSIPPDAKAVQTLLYSAEQFENMICRLEEEFGSLTVNVTSGYRSPRVNRICGGEEDGFHPKFKAFDWGVEELPARRLAREVGRRFKNIGLGNYPRFTHVDFRGYRARWREEC
ncbi:D-Ala-D-Ala carboxypeptidase family metallohydrolase [Nanoarchaeota archaeon]